MLQRLFCWALFICFVFTNLLNTRTNMEAKNLRYSMKNIPIPLKQCCLNNMMEKVESFNHKIKMESTFFNEKEHLVNNLNFGFKSNFTSPQLLSPFVSDLYDMIWSIIFKPVRNDFQKKLAEDINNIKSSENLLIFAEKTASCMKWHLDNKRLF